MTQRYPAISRLLMLTTFMFVGVLGAVAFAGCGGSGIPDDVEWTITQDDSFPHFGKRQVEVRLGQKVSEETLAAIARAVRKEDPDYERIFIVHFLTDRDRATTGWATTHFTPDLDVYIIGLTAEEEEQYLAEPSPGVELIGRWISDHNGALSGLITLYVGTDGYAVRYKFKDGSSMRLKVSGVPDPKARRFKIVDVFPGEYMRIGTDRDLRYYTKDDRLHSTARHVESPNERALRLEPEHQEVIGRWRSGFGDITIYIYRGPTRVESSRRFEQGHYFFEDRFNDGSYETTRVVSTSLDHTRFDFDTIPRDYITITPTGDLQIHFEGGDIMSTAQKTP